MKKRVISLLLAVLMLCSLLPVSAMAAGNTSTQTATVGMRSVPGTVEVTGGGVQKVETSGDTTTITVDAATASVSVKLTLDTPYSINLNGQMATTASATIAVGASGSMQILYQPQSGRPPMQLGNWNFKVEAAAGGEDPEQPGEGGDIELSFPGEKLNIDATGIDIKDAAAGTKTITHLSVYLPVSPYTPYSVNSAWQDGTTIHVVLAEGTAADASLQAGFVMTGSGAAVGASGNKCTLTNGEGEMNVTLNAAGTNVGSYTVKFYVKGIYTGEEAPATLDITTDLSESERSYDKGKPATALTVAAKLSKGEGEISYQWYSNTTKSTEGAAAIEGATEASYTPATTEYGTKYYYAVVTCGELTATSKIAMITVKEPTLTITVNPIGKDYVVGNTVVALTVEAMQSEGAVVTWQWYSYTDSIENAELIAGETSESYTPNISAVGTTYYYAVATSLDKNGEAKLTKATSAAKITVVAPEVKFTTDLSETEVKYTQGKPAAALSVVAEYTGVTENAVTYQWYSYTNSIENAAPIEDATEASYTPGTAELGTTYYYVVASCEEKAATSKAAKITVEAPVVKFTTDLSETEVKYKQDKPAAALNVVAEYTGVTENTVSYQWYSNKENSNTNGTPIEGATEASYTPATAVVGTTYYYVVASCGELSVTSKIATVIVETIPLLDVENNVIDITDKKVWELGKSHVTVTNIKVSGANVEKASEEGTTVNIVLDGITEPGATVSVEFGYTQNEGKVSGHTGSITLEDGKATLVLNVKGEWTFSGKQNSSVPYTLNFSLGAPPSAPPTRLVERDSAEIWQGESVTLDLSKYFAKASDYYLVNGETQTKLEGASYTFNAAEAGEHKLVFGAGNGVGICEDHVTVTVTAKAVEVKFTTDLSEDEVKYSRYADAAALTVAAEFIGPEGASVSYQWYWNSEKSSEGGTAIPGATSASYTPYTTADCTTYYYAVASFGSLSTVSNIATVTVDAIETLPGTEIPVDAGVVDITDKNIATRSSYYVKVVDIKLEDATAESAREDGTKVYIVLDGDMKPDAQFSLEFTHSANYKDGTVSGDTATVTLVNGMAKVDLKLSGTVMYTSATANYTLYFSLGEASTTVPTRLVESDSKEIWYNTALELKLSDYFENAGSYYLVGQDGEKTPLDGATYSFRSTEIGTHTLVFAAANPVGDCADTVTVTVEVADVTLHLDVTTSKGSMDYVLFTDTNGKEIEGLTASFADNVITVSVPRTFDASGIKARFGLTQTDGFPFITTSTVSTGNSTATGNKFTEKTITLSGGKAVFTFYLYNYNPSATSNSYATYKINFAIQNEVPVLADGQEASGTASITADKNYELDLDGIFVDPDDGDTITGWKVSVNGAAAVDAAVDENGVYSWNTKTAGEYTLTFYALDNYKALSTETYTVTLTVDNAATTYDVTVFTPEGLSPVFYWNEAAEEGKTLEAVKRGNVYTVKVPTNVSVIAWRADGVGMNAAVSDGCEALSLVKPIFTVMAGENADEKAAVTVAHDSYTVVGKDNDYLLLVGEKYDFTAVPGEDFEQSWKEVKLNDYTLSEAEVALELISKGTVFTFPRFAELTVNEAVYVQGKAPKTLTPVKTTPVDFATGTQTASYELTNGKVYEYRVSVPSDNENCDQYVTYVATFTMRDTLSITVTAEQLERGDKGRTTIDRNTSSNRGRNVADLYLNVNEKGYKTMNVGEEFQLIATRNYFGVCADWLLNKNIYIVEPDFHYSVVNLEGEPITIDKDGKISAVGNGTAIVLVTYDAMTMNHEASLSEGAVAGYPSLPNDFLGAIWPENTGVFVVSVGAEASGIATGMTINEDKTTDRKTAGKAIDAEFDVIYYIANNGGKGEYTFTPGTEGVSVSVANPSIGSSMSFNGFSAVADNRDGSYSVPLTEGRNIVKLEKDGKAEYQVITAKGINVTVNGEPLETAIVAPGQAVKIEFDKIYNPANRMALYNTSAAVVYSKVSGWDGKMAGNKRGDMGDYVFASNPANRVIEHFVVTGGSGGFGNSSVSTDGALTVPADFAGEYFTLSNGAFNIGGFTRYKFGDHRTRLGKDPDNSGGSDNILLYLGRLPDISIPVGTVTGISATAPTKTTYNIGDVFDPSGMEVTVNFVTAGGAADSKTVAGYTYDTEPFAEAGEHFVTISYGGMSTTVAVTVTDVTLDALEVTTQPNKTFYYIGDTFDPTGMVITAVYSDESTREISDYGYAPETVTKDTTAITVTYGSKSVEVPVTVSLVERIEITAQPNKTEYTEGERFDPTGMIVKAYYTDGTSIETSEYGYLPAGELKTSDTAITVSYTGDEASPNLQSATVDITVLPKQQDGDEGDDKPTEPEKKSIVAYVSFADQGTIVVGKTPVIVYDDDKDGIFTVGDAFRALHRDFYAYGESGYAEVSNELVTGWVIKFWGGGDSTFSYALNNGWASSTRNEIREGDYVAAFNGIDDVAFSDLYTWFVQDAYYATADQELYCAVRAVNIMGSGPAGDASCVPVGATVTVFDSVGCAVPELTTTVGADGRFSIKFTDSGTYTLEVGGTATWGSYVDAPVVPSRCTVLVSDGTATAEDKAAAAEVEKLIDAIGDVTKDSGDAIDAAREAYDKLSKKQQKLVSNYDELVSAEKKYAELTGKTVFDDVSKDAYYYDAVVWAVEMGITKGTGDDTFSPEASCTRAQMVTFLWRAAGEPKAKSTTCAFTDVDTDAYYYEALLWAVENGITSGTSETTFSPDAECTRAQMASFLYRSAETPAVSGDHDFTDVSSDAYYNEAVIWAAAEGITKGTSLTAFSPDADCTRGQMVTFLYRFMAE